MQNKTKMKTAKTKVVKAIQAWIEVNPNSQNTFPQVWWDNPTGTDMQNAKEYGTEIYPDTEGIKIRALQQATNIERFRLRSSLSTIKKSLNEK